MRCTNDIHNHTFSSLLFTQVYERGTNVEQFVTRFLLKESANQIQSLLSSVESAVDAIDEQHSQSGSANESCTVCMLMTVHMYRGIICKTQIVSSQSENQAAFQAQIVWLKRLSLPQTLTDWHTEAQAHTQKQSEQSASDFLHNHRKEKQHLIFFHSHFYIFHPLWILLNFVIISILLFPSPFRLIILINILFHLCLFLQSSTCQGEPTDVREAQRKHRPWLSPEQQSHCQGGCQDCQHCFRWHTHTHAHTPIPTLHLNQPPAQV